MSELKAASFDPYGTLIDWEGGLGAFLYDLGRRRGHRDPGPAPELRKRWEEIHSELLRGAYRAHRDVLEDALRTWVGEQGYQWNVGDAEALEHAIGSWQPFPDAVPALDRAKAAGLRLAIVSNTDRHIMDHTLRQLRPVEFDEVVLAEDVRAYKPDSEPFRRVLHAIDARPDEVVHVALDLTHDIGAAARLGFRTAWMNRRREPPPVDGSFDHEWESLWGLPELAER